MIDKPMFKPHFQVEIVPDEGVLLVSECGHNLLTGRIFELLAPLVDGTRSPDEIVDCLAGEIPPAEVYYGLSLLEKKGCLADANTTSSLAGFWTVRGIDHCKAAERLRELQVSISAIGDVNTRPFVSALESLGVNVAEDGALRLVLTDDYLRAGLEGCNEDALKIKRPWMLIKPVGIEIFVGPLFVPDTTGCWRCLRDRHILNRSVERFVMDRQGREDPPPAPAVHAPATVQVACNMAATEIAKWIALGHNPEIEGQMFSVDTRTWQARRHTLNRLPHCPSCGKPPDAENRLAPVLLGDAKATFTRDGGYRTRSPEETLKKFDHLVSPITGIVNLLEREESLDGSAHVYFAGHNCALRNENLAFLKSGLRNMSAGKGMSEVQAKASGLCEAIERHSGLFQGYESRITSSLTTLGEQAIPPNNCMLFSAAQYRNREGINAKKSKFNFVPLPFEEESHEIEWSPVWSLTHETFKYLPTQYLYYGYRYPDGKSEPVYFYACSNGAASGNNLEEAVLQGFLELVERDSVALWWYNMLKKPAVDLASFDEPYFLELVRWYEKENREVWALDITSDLGIPAFAAVSRTPDSEKDRLIFGFGCHLDARLGVQRALTEMNQCLPYARRAFAEGEEVHENCEDHEAVNWWRTATCENQPYMAPDKDLPVRRSADYPKRPSEDLLENIALCRRIVEERGMEVLVLDQTRPDIGVSVAKVVVPGLRHFWARFAPGRLFDAPVQMGWLQKSMKEEELNPIPMFT